MARQKTPKLVVAFNTTTSAMAFADVCKLGRIVPLPAQVRAGCGLAYCADIACKAEIAELLDAHNIEYFAMQVVELY